MSSGRRTVRRPLVLERIEDRLMPSGAHVQLVRHSTAHAALEPRPHFFVANLSPGQVVFPTDEGNPAESLGLTGPSQIQGGGGAAPFATPPANDPARGRIAFTIANGGKEIKVVGSFSHISNISAVTLHDLNYPAVYPLRGSTTSPATQPPALQPDAPALAASTTTVSTATTTKPATNAPSLMSTTQTQYASASTTVPVPITTTTTTTAVTTPMVTQPSGTTVQTTHSTATATAAPTGSGPNLTPPAPKAGSPLYYAANTVNSAQSTTSGQISSSNTGQTVVLLLNPGNGSGPWPARATFQTVIKAQNLLGALAYGGGYAQLVQDMRSGELYVLVQTNDGYDAGTAAQQDGNFPNGELRGQVVAATFTGKAHQHNSA